MKKIFVALIALFMFPLTANAISYQINTSFDEETCKLTVTGTQNGHEAMVSLFKNNEQIGLKTGTISNNEFSVEFTLGYNTDTTIDIVTADENGENETHKNSVSIKACELPDQDIYELFNNGTSIIINDRTISFERDLRYEFQKTDAEEANRMLENLKNTNSHYYDGYKAIFDGIFDGLGEYKEFIYFFSADIIGTHGPKDYSNYDGGFTLNISLSKEKYRKGIKVVEFSTEDIEYGKVFDTTYDEENEVLVIEIDRPGEFVMYVDNDYSYLNKTNDQTFYTKSDTTLILKIDADLEKFLNIFMDDKEVDKKNYTVGSGSTVITFKEDYLKSLAPGEHKVTVNFTDGTANTTLTIKDATNPKTGDNIKVYMIIFGISLVGTVGVLCKKKLSKKGN